jgi:Multicopper oxidase
MARSEAMRVMPRGLIAMMFSGLLVVFNASADSSIYVQCPTTTALHPSGGGIKCKHLMAGDGMVTMADDAQKKLYIFSFSDVKLPDQALADLDISSLAEYPGWVMDTGLLAANAPAPTISVDEDDELFLSLTNVGMVMRPDLFDPHTIHWHGFPQASSVFDGVPDASISINMGATLTYYYTSRMRGPTCTTATSRRRSTCRWGCSATCTCGRGRTSSRPEMISTMRS